MLYPDSAASMDVICVLSNKELLNKDEIFLCVLFSANFYMCFYRLYLNTFRLILFALMTCIACKFEEL